MFGLNYQEWCRQEDEWRKEMMLKLMTRKMQTVEDLEVVMEQPADEIDAAKNQSADRELSSLEQADAQQIGEAAGVEGPDAGLFGSMDGSIDGSMDGGMDGGIDGGCSM